MLQPLTWESLIPTHILMVNKISVTIMYDTLLDTSYRHLKLNESDQCTNSRHALIIMANVPKL